MRTVYLIAGSFGLHLLGFMGISLKAERVTQHHTLMAVMAEKKAEEKKKPPKPVEANKETLKQQQRIATQAPPPAPTPAAPEPAAGSGKPSAAMAAMPDFGLNLAGGGSGSGPGIAVPQGGGGRGGGTGKAEGSHEKVLAPAGGARAAAPVDPDLAAEIAAWKPHPLVRVKPVYPDEARASEIEGTVTAEVRIDCTGKVIGSKIVKSLGAAFDANVLTAVKKMEFDPAPRCAPGFEKYVKINFAFRLGD